MTITKSKQQEVFERYCHLVRRVLVGDEVTGMKMLNGDFTGEMKFVRNVEDNGNVALLRTTGSAAELGIPLVYADRFRMEVLMATSLHDHEHPGEPCPYTLYEYLRRLIDSFIARGCELPESAAAA